MVDLHKKEHSFGAFTIGVAVGVGAALLFGTEDGRKLAQKLFDSLPEKIKSLKDTTDGEHNTTSSRDLYSNQPARSAFSSADAGGSDPSSIPNSILSSPESTPHTYIANNS